MFAMLRSFFSPLLFVAAVGDKPFDPVEVPAGETRGENAQSVAISADGKYVAAGFPGPSSKRFPLKPRGGGVFVWNAETGEQVFAGGTYGDLIKVGFSRDGRYLAYCRIYTPGDSIEDHSTTLVDLETGDKLRAWRRSEAFAFSPTEDRLLVATSSIEVFDLATLEPKRQIPVRGARSMEFSRDGKTAAAVCYYWENNRGRPTGLAVFSPDQEKPRFIVDDESLRSAMAVAVAPDGKHVVTGHSGGEARTWSALEDSEPQRVIRVETKTALFPLFHDGGKSLILATQPARGVHWTYDRSKPSGFDFKGGTSPPTCELRFLAIPSGEAQDIWRFVDGSFRTIYARFGSSKQYPEYNPSRFAVSRDGKTLVAGCNGCCTIDVKTGKVTHAFDRIRPQDSQD